MPYKGRNFNPRTLETCFILLFVWLVVIGFKQNYFHISPNFGDFAGGENVIFSLHYQPKTENIYKTLPTNDISYDAKYLQDPYFLIYWYKILHSGGSYIK